MTSPCLKLGISFPVRFAIPFAGGRERVIDRSGACLGENDAVLLDLVGELVPILEAERGLDPSKLRLQAARLFSLSLLIMTINESYNIIIVRWSYGRNWVMIFEKRGVSRRNSDQV